LVIPNVCVKAVDFDFLNDNNYLEIKLSFRFMPSSTSIFTFFGVDKSLNGLSQGFPTFFQQRTTKLTNQISTVPLNEQKTFCVPP
jgi:hypothetical protein